MKSLDEKLILKIKNTLNYRRNKMKLKLIILFLALLLISSLSLFAQENVNIKGKVDINVQLLGNGFGLGMNAAYGLSDKIFSGLGASIDPLIFVMGFDFHLFFKYYFFDTPLNLYLLVGTGFFDGESTLFNYTEKVMWVFSDVRAGIQYSFGKIYIALDIGPRYNFIQDNTFDTNLILWGGLSIGLRF